MARIRTIKPEFPQSESLGRVSRDARLLFVELWPICDDHGRTRAASRMLASLLFPYDKDAPDLIDGWLDELEREDCIRRYMVDGSTYLYIPKWLIHQKIDKPSKPQHPNPPEHSPSPREDSRTFVVGREGKGREGKGPDNSSLRSESSTAPPLDLTPPDDVSLEKKPASSGSKLAAITEIVIAEYNAHLSKKVGGLLRRATSVGIDEHRKNVNRCLKVVSRACADLFDGDNRIRPEFWRGYFKRCAADEFLSGRQGGGKDHPNWKPDLEYLTRPATVARVYEMHAGDGDE